MIRSASLAAAMALSLAAPGAFAQGAGDTPPAPPPSDSTVALPARPAPAAAVAPLAPATLLGPSSPTPSRPHVVLPRAAATIARERVQMIALGNAAENDLLEAKKQQAGTKATVEAKQRAVDTLATRLKAARKAKDGTTRATLDTERGRQESMRTYFEHALDVADAAVDEAQARGEYAHASVLVLDLEKELVDRAGAPAYDADPAVFKLEQQYLEAVAARGAAEERLAARAQALADRQLKLYRAWADWLGGR